MFTEIDYMTVADHKNEGDWPFDWLPVKGLIPYIKRLGPDARGIEIGVARAESSYAILEACANVTRLYGIDPYIAYDDWNGHVDQEHNDKTKEIAVKNMSEFGYRFLLMSRSSKSVISIPDEMPFDEKSMDFIFIDGDHSYEGAKWDIENYYGFIRPGGIFSGHDYNLGTVRTALEEFRSENKIRLPVQVVDNNAWYMTVM
jgi:predicted O-methyltransferase YrrM